MENSICFDNVVGINDGNLMIFALEQHHQAEVVTVNRGANTLTAKRLNLRQSGAFIRTSSVTAFGCYFINPSQVV